MTKNKNMQFNRTDSPVVKTLLSVREVWGSNRGSVISDTESPTACRRCSVSLELCRLGAKPRRWAPPFRYTPRGNTASLMKI